MSLSPEVVDRYYKPATHCVRERAMVGFKERELYVFKPAPPVAVNVHLPLSAAEVGAGRSEK